MPIVLPINREPRKDFELSLDEIAREGARRLLVQALNLEVEDYIQQFKEEVDENGRRLVVRNGIGRARKVTMGSGTVEVRCPKKPAQGPSSSNTRKLSLTTVCLEIRRFCRVGVRKAL